ncbi:EamA family transporter [Thalassotalea sp. M1531]|uniref:EamA family transporter n=1 Tax=Thalassotalea algicola TaxID=2716224 RepID=A0A7Y0LC04_9GAMM|nr:EamA family transporter [Thalassotalea algicola]NMP31753.1 EamA family transporter [Thalassotalea algicola]
MNNSVLYLLTVLIWGSTWIAINYQLGDVAHEASIAYRFGLAAAVLFIYCWLKKLPLTMNKQQHLSLILFGMALFGFNYFLLYQAQENINSALACIGFSTLLLFNIINARIWYKTPITSQVVLGGSLGLIGIVILFWPEVKSLSLTDATLYGLILCLIGTLSASMGNMISIRNQKAKMPVVQSNAWGMLYGTIFMIFMVIVQGKTFTFEWTTPYISSLLFLSIFGSVIAFGCYLSLMTKIGPHKTSYANILFPAVAVAISTVVEGFAWNNYTIFGFLAIMVGNFVVLAKPRAAKKAIEQENSLAKSKLTNEKVIAS